MSMKKITEKFAEAWKLPKDVVMDLPRVSICGDREIYIENHKGLDRYDDDCIRIKMNNGTVVINGTGLRIVALEYNSIVVNGIFKSVEYDRGGSGGV